MLMYPNLVIMYALSVNMTLMFIISQAMSCHIIKEALYRVTWRFEASFFFI